MHEQSPRSLADRTRGTVLAGLNRRYPRAESAMRDHGAIDCTVAPFPSVPGHPEEGQMKHPARRSEARLLAMLFLGLVLLGVVAGLA